MVPEAEGLRLHLSSRSDNRTGYVGVSARGPRFEVSHRRVYLGHFDTAVEAAAAYARAVAAAGQEPVAACARAVGQAGSGEEAELEPTAADEIVTAIVCDGCDGGFELPPGTLAPEGEWFCAACYALSPTGGAAVAGAPAL